MFLLFYLFKINIMKKSLVILNIGLLFCCRIYCIIPNLINAKYHIATFNYFPEQIFYFSSLPGHAEAVISLSFGPQGDKLASGSGDTTVRLWDILTQTPIHVCKGHRQWVLCVSWSPCGTKLASGCKAGEIKLWNPETGQQIGKTLIGHKQYITSLSWEPYHRWLK